MIDPYSEFVVSLLHFDGSSGSTVFTDTANPATFTVVGSAQISTAQSKFGGASLELNGTSGILQPYRATLDLGQGAFTFETFVRRTETTGFVVLMSRASSTLNIPREMAVCLNGANKIELYYGVRGTSSAILSFAIPTMATNTWYHVALCRSDSGLVQAYLDGVASATTYTDTTDLSGNQPMLIGRFWDTGLGLSGFLDEMRVTRGVARYSANFTPPSAAFDDPIAPVITYRGLLGPVGRLACEPPAALYPAGGICRGSVVGQRDAYYAGGGRVAGTVKQTGSPATPLRRKVRLIDEPTGWLMRETWSDPLTGAYSFEGVDPLRVYTVITYDHPHNYRAVIADNITPGLMP